MSRGAGDQVWPYLRHVIGDGREDVSTLETDDGTVQMTGPGIRKHDDGTVTVAGSNVEHDPKTGNIRIVGRAVR